MQDSLPINLWAGFFRRAMLCDPAKKSISIFRYMCTVFRSDLLAKIRSQAIESRNSSLSGHWFRLCFCVAIIPNLVRFLTLAKTRQIDVERTRKGPWSQQGQEGSNVLQPNRIIKGLGRQHSPASWHAKVRHKLSLRRMVPDRVLQNIWICC